MKNQLLYRFSAFTLFFAGALIAYVYVLLFVPMTVIQPFIQPYPVTSRVVHPGGTLTYLPQYCKYLDVPAVTERSFVNNLVYATPQTISHLPAGCHKEPVTIRVPIDLPSGTYHLELDVTYHVNILRSEVHHFKTDSFQVVN